ncbi:MAG TPA: DUF177 domain-containing protein [Bacillota bacterium]|jgi:uncharacterized protein
MRIDVSRLGEQTGDKVSFFFEEPFPALEGEAGSVAIDGPVEVRGEAYNTGSAVHVRGRVKARAELLCSRCSKPLVQPVEAPFQVQYVAERPGRPGADNDEADDVVQYQGDEIDLADEVRQQLLLALPMKPLCRPDCRGLCPTCGKDLNEGPCECRPEVDARLAGLADLFKELKVDNSDARGGGTDGRPEKKDFPR